MLTIKMSKDTVLAWKKVCALAKECQPKSKRKGRETMDKFGVNKLIKKALSVPNWKKPSFTDSVIFDQKTGLYLPVSKFDMGIDFAKSKDFSAVGYTNYASTANLPSVTSWSLGVAMLRMKLVDVGFHSRRLAELMYTASRVFEHNLAVQAQRHRMRMR